MLNRSINPQTQSATLESGLSHYGGPSIAKVIPNQYNNMSTIENKLNLGTPSKEMMDMVNVGGSAANLGNYMSSIPGRTSDSRRGAMNSGDIKSRERVMAV